MQGLRKDPLRSAVGGGERGAVVAERLPGGWGVVADDLAAGLAAAAIHLLGLRLLG